MAFPKGIQKLTSTGGSVTITNPNGPVTNVETAGGGGGGITTLTGDVTAGPGSGSQAATLVGTANVEAIIAANATVAAKAPLASPTFTGTVTVPDAVNPTDAAQLSDAIDAAAAVQGLPLGLTGAVAATRYAGATASGHPTTGTFAVGDFVIDQTGSFWICTVAGTPGTWILPTTIASLSGLGIDNSPAQLTQSGGFAIQDPNGDGVTIDTAGSVYVQDTGGGSIDLTEYVPTGEINMNAQGLGSISIGYPPGLGGPFALPTSSYTYPPLTVVAGVNDTFIYTTSGPTVLHFTVAPGTYSTPAEIQAAWAAAACTDTGPYLGLAFGSFSNTVKVSQNYLWIIGGNAGDTLTAGATDILAAFGFASPTTYIAGSGDVLKFFGAAGAALQSVTGSLSTVVDPAVKAILTALIAALAQATGYGLVVDATT